jgi:hypothetical protein
MSYESAYEEYVDKILAQIVFDLRQTDVLPKENVAYGFYKQWKHDQYPNAFIRFVRDRIYFATKDEEEHRFIFEIKVTIKGTGNPEADQDEQIRVIGQIYDKIREDNTLDGNASWVKFQEINITFRRSESYIFYDCLLTLEVCKIW